MPYYRGGRLGAIDLFLGMGIMRVINFTGFLGQNETVEIESIEEGLALRPHGMFQVWGDSKGYIFSKNKIIINDDCGCQIDELSVDMVEAKKIFSNF